jgi:hypothetical protein
MSRFSAKDKIKIDGKLFVGIAFVLAGISIAWMGYSQAKLLWSRALPFFPLSLPPDVSERVLASLSFIAKDLISAISSLCAILIGIMWFFSGLGDALRSGQLSQRSPDFAGPELVSETLRTGFPQHWRLSSWSARLIGTVWKSSRNFSPISYELTGRMLKSCLKILLLALLIALVFQAVSAVPGLLRRYLQVSVTYLVPSARPLYLLIGLTLLANVVLIATFFPFRRKEFSRSGEAMAIKGCVNPPVFFALLEEGCKLLNVSNGPPRPPIRFAAGELTKGTLIENFPENWGFVARPGGFLCLPLSFFPLVLGFSRLVHFQRPAFEMPYMEFLKVHAFDYVFEVLLGIGLIMVGLYFAEWARVLFSIRRYRSDLVFCYAVENSESSGTLTDRQLETVDWTPSNGADSEFANWAKNPDSNAFRVEVFWAEVLSEAAGPDSPRYIVGMQEQERLNRSMWRILTIPFVITVEAEDRQILAGGSI